MPYFIRIYCLIMGLTILQPEANAQVFQSSNLPIVVINTAGQEIVDEPKITVSLSIIDNGNGVRNALTDPANVYNGSAGIELRGSSSRVLFPKKQYGVELRTAAGGDNAVSLLGLPEEEDWILSAPYNDKTLMRDVLTYKLGRDMGRYAPRTRYCELVLNGVYQGVYFLNEKIKRDKYRVDINSLNPDEVSGDNLTGGYIIKLDKTDGDSGPGFDSEFPPANLPGKKVTFQYEYPKWDEIVSAQKDYIKKYVSQFENALAGPEYADPATGYAHYIDVDSFVDFFIMNELTKNVDGYRLSSFFYKQKDSQGGKLFAGPIWDFNLGFGNTDYCTKGSPTGFVYSEFNTVCPTDTWFVPFWWERLFLDANFGMKVSTRWTSLRQNKFSTSTVHAYIDSVASVLNMESQQRNFQRWPVLNTYVWPNYYVGPTFQAEVSWLKDWIRDRASWLDNNLPQLVTSLDGERMAGVSVSMFPNPSSAAFNVLVSGSTTSQVMVQISSATGVIIDQRDLSRDQDGGYSATVGETIPAGFYIYHIVSQGRKIATGKIIKR